MLCSWDMLHTGQRAWAPSIKQGQARYEALPVWAQERVSQVLREAATLPRGWPRSSESKARDAGRRWGTRNSQPEVRTKLLSSKDSV